MYRVSRLSDSTNSNTSISTISSITISKYLFLDHPESSNDNKGGPDQKGRLCELSDRLKTNVDKYE